MIKLTIEELQELNIIPIDYEKCEFLSRELEYSILCDFLVVRNNKAQYSMIQENYNKNTLYPFIMFYYYCKYNNDNIMDIPLDYKNKSEKQIVLEKKMLKWYKAFDKSFNEKITGFATRWNFEKEYIYNLLLADEDFRLLFSKDPAKQTLHQHLAASWIKEIPFVNNFEEPINHGNDAYYVFNGVIKKGKDLIGQKVGKSIDFVWEYEFNDNKLKFYATHKHTKIAGGSQDNQFEDVCLFQEQAQKCTKQDTFLLSITDGQYYLDKYTKDKENNWNKIEFLNNRYSGKRNIATTSNKLVNDIIPIIKSWLLFNFSTNEIKEELEKLNIINDLYLL